MGMGIGYIVPISHAMLRLLRSWILVKSHLLRTVALLPHHHPAQHNCLRLLHPTPISTHILAQHNKLNSKDTTEPIPPQSLEASQLKQPQNGHLQPLKFLLLSLHNHLYAILLITHRRHPHFPRLDQDTMRCLYCCGIPDFGGPDLTARYAFQ